MTIQQVWENFIQTALQWHKQQQLPLLAWADAASPSPCQQGDIIDQQVQWQPVLQPDNVSFENVEYALDIRLHPDIKHYYSQYYGAGLGAEHSRGKLQLLMVWNEEDFARLQENIIGHILMKRRLKQRETVFFAVTEDENLMLSVLNQTGEVFIESVGKEVSEKLADNLAGFIQQLTPADF